MLRIRLVEEGIAARYAEQGIRCPTHFAIGQEAIAAGVCAALAPMDLVFGTYRSHGLYLAKGGDLKALVAELYGKATGCTRGRGGSMQLIAPEVGLVCASAIVGGTIPMAVGAALSARLRRTGQVAAAVFGDGATEEGVFHESLNFASLKRLPVVFVCENNFYACYSPQRSRQPLDNIAERAAGYGIPGRRVDGNDAAAVREAVGEAAERARRGEGPSLIECRTYRWLEHVGPADDTPLGYRSPEEVAAWKARCPVTTFGERLLREGLLRPDAMDVMRQEIARELDDAVAFAKASPFPDPTEVSRHVYATGDAGPPRPPEAGRGGGRPPRGSGDGGLHQRAEAVSPGARWAAAGGGTRDSQAPVARGASRHLSYCEAINEALHQAMAADEAVMLLGEGVDDPRAIFGSTRGLRERFGDARVFDMPLSENGMTGVMIGAALTGLRPVMTHQRMDFLLYAMDQLVNHAAKRCYSSGGRQSVPMVIRAIVGRGWGQGPQHSQSLQAWLAHVPGLKVIMPSTPYDAKGLLLSAIADPNPVVCIEHRRLYDLTGDVPEPPYAVPIGTGVIRRDGSDVTIVTASHMAVEAEGALPVLQRAGISAEVIDVRTVKPFDASLILSSVEKTGRLVVADTGWAACGFSAEIAALAAERAFGALKAPIRRVALPDAPAPTSHTLEQAFYPGAEAIIRAVFEVLGCAGMPERTRIAAEPVFVGPF